MEEGLHGRLTKSLADPAMVVYAEQLLDEGFTIYLPRLEPTRSTGHTFFSYSRETEGQVCFGYIQQDRFPHLAEAMHWDGYEHSMPIYPSREHGSSMFLDALRRWNSPPSLSVAAAVLVARPWNTNSLIGQKRNCPDYDKPINIYQEPILPTRVVQTRDLAKGVEE